MTDRPLTVTHFSTADVIGGSAQSAYRIHSGLRAAGLRSRMLVGFRASDDPDVDTVYADRAGQWADRIANRVTGSMGLQYAFLPSGRRVMRHPWVRDAGIIQLFNTHGGYFSPSLLPALGRRAPIVWRLSDLWPMTGHCAYPGACERWRTGCGACPDLTTYPALSRDTTAAQFRRKRRLYEDLPMTVVATSSWTEACARQSPLLGHFRILRIPNGLDGDVFRPLPRDEACAVLRLDPSRPVILFAAHILDNNPRKGGNLLIEALRHSTIGPGASLVLVGEGGGSWEGQTPCSLVRLGFQSDPGRLAGIYAAADVVAIPSAVENLPNVLIEAMACGKPVVASDAGGMADGVRHMETGYLAKPGDAADLAAGIEAILGDADLRARMGIAARTLFESEFSAGREIQRFCDLYRDLVYGTSPEAPPRRQGNVT